MAVDILFRSNGPTGAPPSGASGGSDKPNESNSQAPIRPKQTPKEDAVLGYFELLIRILPRRRGEAEARRDWAGTWGKKSAKNSAHEPGKNHRRGLLGGKSL